MANEDTYAERLRAALDRDDWSQGRLVRELAAATGNAVESERTAVRGYLKGSIPRAERAGLIAEVTGVPELAETFRRTGTGRIEARLEELARAVGQSLENQETAMAALGEIRAMCAQILEDEQDVPKRSRRR